MPYQKNKQQAFQAAQQGYEEAMDANQSQLLSIGKGNYGQELSHLTNEIQEAYQQIDKALEVASEHQAEQLMRYQEDLNKIMNDIDVNDLQ